MIRKSLHLAAAFAVIFLACPPLFAARTLVDNFNVGTVDIERWGNPPYPNATTFSLQDTYQTVAGPIGGIRQIHVADAHNGTVNNPNAMTVNTTNGTLDWWGGATAPVDYVAYGSAASGGGGSALGLSKLVTDGFVIDIPHSTDAGRTDGTLSITLNIGAGGGGGTVS
ncbi:MAG: hypothetical protein K8T25_22605 [Planctomycetia bacterium]|nr:hypothetical protein [Planctomycetia bacterium]